MKSPRRSSAASGSTIAKINSLVRKGFVPGTGSASNFLKKSRRRRRFIDPGFRVSEVW